MKVKKYDGGNWHAVPFLEGWAVVAEQQEELAHFNTKKGAEAAVELLKQDPSFWNTLLRRTWHLRADK